MNVSFITLGCKVNSYESNYLKEELIKKGYSIIDPSKETDIFIINTCAVTNKAEQKSRQMISKAKSFNSKSIICLIGCYVETSKETLDFDCDIIIGNKNKLNLVEYLDERIKENKKIINVDSIKDDKEFKNTLVTSYDKSRAFIKIEDGCNQYCTYCIIPYTRGHVRSKNFDIVLKEISLAVVNGYEEIVFTGIHTGKYSYDGKSFSTLLKESVKFDGLKRIRISSLDINEIDDDFYEVLKNPKIADHLHLSLQSGNDRILRLMNRPYDSKKFYDVVEKIKKIRPNISITTDVIVGFPTETEKEFNDTFDFCQKIGFSYIHVFPFSKRKGTRAFFMEDIDSKIKKIRSRSLNVLSKELNYKYNLKFLNKKVDFLVETINEINGY